MPPVGMSRLSNFARVRCLPLLKSAGAGPGTLLPAVLSMLEVRSVAVISPAACVHFQSSAERWESSTRTKRSS